MGGEGVRVKILADSASLYILHVDWRTLAREESCRLTCTRYVTLDVFEKEKTRQEKIPPLPLIFHRSCFDPPITIHFLREKRAPILDIAALAVINQALLLGTDHTSEELSFMIHRHQAFLRIAMNLIAYSILGGSFNLIVEVCWTIKGIEAVTFNLCIKILVCKP